MAMKRKPFIFFGIAAVLATLAALSARWTGEGALILTMLTPALAAFDMLGWVNSKARLRQGPVPYWA
jgi:hypothetical protein